MLKNRLDSKIWKFQQSYINAIVDALVSMSLVKSHLTPQTGESQAPVTI